MRTVARLSFAAGAVGVVSFFLLAGLYAGFAIGGFDEPPAWGLALGAANDIVYSIAAALMIPVAFAVRQLLPGSRRQTAMHWSFVAALVAITFGGPALVAGLMPDVASGVVGAVATWMLLLWVFAVSRWLHPRPAWRRACRLGIRIGMGVAGALALMAIGAVALLADRPQLGWVLAGCGIAIGTAAYLGAFVWFLLAGAALHPREQYRTGE